MQIPQKQMRWLIVISWLSVFALVILGKQILVLRDSGHFCEPLFRWNAAQIEQGQLPIWNPNENLGMPNVADATSSVFYPLKIIFQIPWLSFYVKSGIFTSIHVLIAAFGAMAMARRFRCNQFAAVLAGIAYGFGGCVLFQASNVIFLLGAAWLPWASLCVWQIFRSGNIRWCFGLSLCLAMLVLGGDPQMAYHVGLLGGLLWLLHSIGPIANSWKSKGVLSLRNAKWKLLALLGLSACMAGGLSAVQILPTQQWSRGSVRRAFDTPRNIYEVPSYLAREDSAGLTGVSEGLLGELKGNSHQLRLYHFSQPPWTICELLWPGITGDITPKNARWASSSPVLGRVWHSSIYLGLIPFLLAIGQLSFYGTDRRRVWLTWAAVLAVFGSFGWYGGGYFLKYSLALLGISPPNIPNQVGGFYWSLVSFVPGYSDFRYPAKLFTIANLALSILGAIGFSKLQRRQVIDRANFLLVAVFLMSLAAMAAAWLRHDQIMDWLQARSADPYMGTFDSQGSLRSIWQALIHTALVSGIASVLIACFRRRMFPYNMTAATVVILSAIEIIFANSGTVPTVSPAAEHKRVAQALDSIVESNPEGRIYRMAPDGDPSWLNTSSVNRVEEIYQWENDVLYGLNGIGFSAGILDVDNSIPQQDFATFFEVVRESGESSIDIDISILNLLSVEWIAVPRDMDMDLDDNLTSTVKPDRPDDAAVRVVQNLSAFPRSWVVHNVEIMPSLTSNSHQAVTNRTREILKPNDKAYRDFLTEAVIETNEKIRFEPHDGLAVSSCELVHRKQLSAIYQAKLGSPGLLVMNDYFTPDWKCLFRKIDKKGKSTEEWQEAKVFRCNRIMRGVFLPEGKFEIRMTYDSQSLRIGSWISIVSVCMFCVLLIAVRRKKTSA